MFNESLISQLNYDYSKRKSNNKCRQLLLQQKYKSNSLESRFRSAALYGLEGGLKPSVHLSERTPALLATQ